MIRRLKYTGETEVFIIGSLFDPGVYYEIQPHDIRRFQEFESLKDMIDDGSFVVNDGVNDLENKVAGYSYFMAANTFDSSIAMDLNGIDQVVTVDSPVVIAAQRKLWDALGDYDLPTNKFSPPIDGVWNANGTIAVNNQDNVAKIQIEIFRNDELWFTVAQVSPSTGSNFVTFSCDIDAYKSESHNFDLRIHLQKINEVDPCSITISGSVEETAWGMTFLQQLVTPSPT
tara:strand:+ start:137 stop:823 length:687 start_codon:yes stop_codon:yes gene_type:complete